MKDRLTIALCAPADFDRATLVGRLWLPDVGGPALVAVRSDGAYDLSRIAATVSGLLELDDPVRAIRAAGDLPRLAELRRTMRSRMESSPLMDGAALVADLESAYRMMWRRRCAG